MAILSNLLSASEPKGFWITIIKAFEAFTNNYVLAIILITIILRLVWCFVELGMKYSQQRMSGIQAKMQPELEKLQAKYANQPQILQQKQNELQQKYYGKSQVGSCLIMLLTTALNMVIFFTLFAGLNTMSSYKNSINYDNIKYTYANCLNVTDAYLSDEDTDKYGTYDDRLEYFADYENLSFVFREIEVSADGENSNETIKKTVVDIVYLEDDGNGNVAGKILYTADYKDEKGFTTKEIIPAEKEGQEDKEIEVTNKNIITLIEKYFPVYEKDEVVGSKEVIVRQDDVATEENETIYLSTALQNVAMDNVIQVYDENKESFLWIKNIWIADSPFNKSIVSYSTLESQIGKKNIEKGEITIYNAFMPELKDARSKTNGYFIIPILCVAVAVLSMYLTNLYNNRKNKKRGLPPVKQNAGWMKIIMPLLLGVFALFYNSVFAIYMLMGQVVSMLMIIPQLMLIDFIIDKKNKKNDDKNKVVVEYSRKF